MSSRNHLEKWSWSPDKVKGAQLCALGGRTRAEIAELCGISVRGLARWKEQPEFQARVDELVKQWQEKVKTTGVALKVNRILRLHRRIKLMDQVLAARAADPKNKEIAGGETGLLVYHKVSIGVGLLNTIQDEWNVDTGLLKELREHEEQVAREMGHRSEKHEISGPGGGPIPLMAVRLADAFSLEELQAAKQRLLAKGASAA